MSNLNGYIAVVLDEKSVNYLKEALLYIHFPKNEALTIAAREESK